MWDFRLPTDGPLVVLAVTAGIILVGLAIALTVPLLESPPCAWPEPCSFGEIPSKISALEWWKRRQAVGALIREAKKGNEQQKQRMDKLILG